MSQNQVLTLSYLLNCKRSNLQCRIVYCNTHSTQKSLVRHQNAWFDTKKPGSTQKCPVQHKNALPSMHQLTLPLSPPTRHVRYIFFQFYSNILFLRTHREMNENEIILIWIQIYSISLCKLKCNYSFLFVMTIMSAAINKCYRYGRIFCQFLHFLLIAPLKSNTHIGPSSLLAQ